MVRFMIVRMIQIFASAMVSLCESLIQAEEELWSADRLMWLERDLSARTGGLVR